MDDEAVRHMPSTCPECGTPLVGVDTCRDYFYELLLLEAQVPGAPGALPHLFAVASYNLQHPSLFTPETLITLRAALDDVLAGRATIRDLRRRMRYFADGPTRVLRRPDQEPAGGADSSAARWPTHWPLTVLDVCRVTPEQYIDRVRQWAEAVSSALGGAM